MDKNKNKQSFLKAIENIKADIGVVVAVMVDDHFTVTDVSDHMSQGMDVAELRIDLFQNREISHVLQQIEKFSALPTLATIRTHFEGGKWQGSEDKRIKLFKAIAPHVDAIDIELSQSDTIKTLRPILKDNHCDLVASYHNFNQTPDRQFLLKLMEDATEAGVNILKIACMVNSDQDKERLAALLEIESHIPFIIIAMGELAMSSRISFPSLGSMLTYSPSGKITPDDGQIPFTKMITMLENFYPDYKKKRKQYYQTSKIS